MPLLLARTGVGRGLALLGLLALGACSRRPAEAPGPAADPVHFLAPEAVEAALVPRADEDLVLANFWATW